MRIAKPFYRIIARRFATATAETEITVAITKFPTIYKSPFSKVKRPA